MQLKLHLAGSAGFAVGLLLFVCWLRRGTGTQHLTRAPLFRALLTLSHGRVGRGAALTVGSLILSLDVDCLQKFISVSRR